MNISLKKTIAQVDRCLLDSGEVNLAKLHKMYELVLRLQSQLLSVIYDAETFGGFSAQKSLVQKQSHGTSEYRTAGTHNIGFPPFYNMKGPSLRSALFSQRHPWLRRISLTQNFAPYLFLRFLFFLPFSLLYGTIGSTYFYL